MISNSKKIGKDQESILRDLGARLRDYRKRMKISSIATAEAAGISRITLYRIERGEASVAMGAYMSVIYALGLKIQLEEIFEQKKVKKIDLQKIPKKIRIADYKQLKRLAWQLKSSKTLTPQETIDLYERNWRHIDFKNLEENEKKLISSLLAFFGRERVLV